jgi:hypothetical protein
MLGIQQRQRREVATSLTGMAGEVPGVSSPITHVAINGPAPPFSSLRIRGVPWKSTNFGGCTGRNSLTGEALRVRLISSDDAAVYRSEHFDLGIMHDGCRCCGARQVISAV